uniref:Uncharacterized protein n=1 Tax=Amorphochlora amoebiformis TaxID=1561963 RepID=A0A7S0DE49_9EUKA|mmetsp:Transcript_23273/g.36550  ORF Transcript_23273/g.36550 Transcript_23273/m.36550 type:complete len:211 (+) Transcript_23273:1-633(+)
MKPSVSRWPVPIQPPTTISLRVSLLLALTTLLVSFFSLPNGISESWVSAHDFSLGTLVEVVSKPVFSLAIAGVIANRATPLANESTFVNRVFSSLESSSKCLLMATLGYCVFLVHIIVAIVLQNPKNDRIRYVLRPEIEKFSGISTELSGVLGFLRAHIHFGMSLGALMGISIILAFVLHLVVEVPGQRYRRQWLKRSKESSGSGGVIPL